MQTGFTFMLKPNYEGTTKVHILKDGQAVWAVTIPDFVDMVDTANEWIETDPRVRQVGIEALKDEVLDVNLRLNTLFHRRATLERRIEACRSSKR